jgi:phenylpropionate dioxygenase-like ring-hydroxylating dioxygenase large terminal subunit
MIINNWYPAEYSNKVKDSPLTVRMLGCDFVLFRTENSEVVCLSGVCCHRGGSLGRGKCVNSCVQCPYHGWTFNSDGNCTSIPPLGDGVKIPKRARVDSYPTQEKYGLIWTFLGDMNEAERPALADSLPEYGDTAKWRMVCMQREWACNWQRMVENLIDTSHVHFVHSFGKHLPSKMKIFPVEETEWGGRIKQVFEQVPTEETRTAMSAPQAEKPRDRSVVITDFDLIGLLHKNSQEKSSGYDQIIWSVSTPIDFFHTRQFILHFRGFLMEPEHDENMRKTLDWNFDEDAAILEHQLPRLTPGNISEELIVASDDAELVYRRMADDVRKQLGAIDIAAMERVSKDQVRVIPSPARAKEPGNWIHKPLELI